MSTDLTSTKHKDTIEASDGAESMSQAGQIANIYAERNVFANYAEKQADNTLRRQRADLGIFAAFLQSAGIEHAPDAAALLTKPDAWRGVTWGIVEAFRNWQIGEGYAVGTVNVRLATVRTYTRLATKAGVLTTTELALIRNVEGYNRKEAKRIDERRGQTRTGHKKAHSVSLTKVQADALKDQPDTPQGHRDALIMALLLDHGLRVGELAALQVTDVNLAERVLRFYRAKVDKEQTHRLTLNSIQALRAWISHGDCFPVGPLLRGSRKGGELTDAGMSERAITERVRVLGKAVGVTGLSAHDCRHYWATRAAQQGTDPFALQEAGGWSSLAMPRRYVEDAKIANEGVNSDGGRLDYEKRAQVFTCRIASCHASTIKALLPGRVLRFVGDGCGHSMMWNVLSIGA